MIQKVLHKLGIQKRVSSNLFTKFLFVFLSLLIVVILLFTYRSFIRSSEDIAKKTVQALSSSLDTPELRFLSAEKSDLDTSAYHLIKKFLMDGFPKTSVVEKAYYYTLREGLLYTLADSKPMGSESSALPGDTYAVAPPEAYRIFEEEPLLVSKPHTDQWGTWVSVYMALPYGEKGLPLAFGLDIKAREFCSVAKLRTLGIAVILIILMLFGFVAFLAVKTTKLLYMEKKKADGVSSLLKTLQQKEQKEKILIETTLQSLGEGVISTDIEGRVVLMNRMAQHLSGWDIGDAKGQLLKDVYRVVDGHTHMPPETSWPDTVLETGIPLKYDNHEVKLVGKSGQMVPIEDMIYPILNEEGVTTGVVVIFIDGTEKRLKQDELLYLSSYDKLTGLLNRQTFYAKLHELDLPQNCPMVLMLLDINGLKLINEAYGHATGDSLLNEIAIILQRPWHKAQMVGRVDGDEFAIFFPNATEEVARKVSTEIQEILAEHSFLGYALSISIGYAKKEYVQTTISELHKKAEDDLLRNKFVENQGARLKMVDLLLQSLFKKSEREMSHSKRVGSLARRFGLFLGFSKEEQDALHTAGVMHDIGKIAISTRTLNKERKLSSEEWKEMQRHPEIGFNILSSVNRYAPIAEQVLCHHERWDGKGYPNMIAGEQIPLYSRILNLCDSFDAMTSLRPYRDRVSASEALEEIMRCSATQFDPTLAAKFISMIREESGTESGENTVLFSQGT